MIIGILTKLLCTSGPNSVILAWTGDELSRWQIQSSELGKIWLISDISPWRSQSIIPPKIGTLTKVFCTFDPNLVILTWTDQELSCRQACDWHTDRWTDKQMQATAIPEGQNWSQVKELEISSSLWKKWNSYLKNKNPWPEKMKTGPGVLMFFS